MRCVILSSVLLGACSLSSVDLPALAEQTFTFAAVQDGDRISGTVLFNDVRPGTEGARSGSCLSLDPSIRATLYGAELARTSGACTHNGIADRWLIPEARMGGTEDLNLVISDGTNVARAVIPGALAVPRLDVSELLLDPSHEASVRLPGIPVEVELSYLGADGTQWSVPVSWGSFTAAPGSGSGIATISGRMLIEASSCRGFAGCRAEMRFSISVPARYVAQ